MSCKRSLTTLLLFFATATFAQHDMQGMHNRAGTEADKQQPQQADTSMHMNMADDHMMTSSFSPSLPMSRDGSGTSWSPDATPLYGYMVHKNKWMFMFHGDVFIRYNTQGNGGKHRRGGSKWDAPDMLMAMGQRKIGQKGLFHFNVMLSTDALIAGGEGYPLLFQTGESWHGQPLVDRQHPHDLFSELSVSYAYSFSKKSDAFVYVGYPGEPALGPGTFMHRPAGKFMPDAPIGHHWEDATHISFGAATVGWRYEKFRLEGSSFTGREPDEHRYDFDKPLFDSWSGRLSFNPSEHWALQASHGFLKAPERLHPDEDIERTTASATYLYCFSDEHYITGTALWGQNKIEYEDWSNALLIEALYKMKKLAVYARYESVQKSAEELNLNVIRYGLYNLYTVSSVGVGAGYDLFTAANTRFAIGGQVTLNMPEEALYRVYGRHPMAGEVYLHIYPGLMKGGR